MNKKTTLSKFIDLKKKWKKYIKQFSPLPHKWAIISDYCLGDANKPNNVLSFSICPYPISLFFCRSEINTIMKNDIKHTRNIPQQMINYIKKQTTFFTISYVIRTPKCINVQLVQASIDNYIQKCKNFQKQNPSNELSETIKGLEPISAYLKKNKFNQKHIKNFIYIASITAEIMEFLTINQGVKEIIWISDRDPAISFKNGVIFNYTKILYNQKIGNRRNNTSISYTKLKENRECLFDGLIRFPDTITAALASYNFENKTVDRPKHLNILSNAIADNERIFIIDITSEWTSDLSFKLNSTDPKLSELS